MKKKSFPFKIGRKLHKQDWETILERQTLSQDYNLIKYRFSLGDKFGVENAIHFVLNWIRLLYWFLRSYLAPTTLLYLCTGWVENGIAASQILILSVGLTALVFHKQANISENVMRDLYHVHNVYHLVVSDSLHTINLV